MQRGLLWPSTLEPPGRAGGGRTGASFGSARSTAIGGRRVPPLTLLTFKMFLAGHIVPDAVHLLGGDLMDGDDPAVAAEAVGHLPVVEAAVLEGVDAELTEAHAHVDVLQVQQPGVQRRLVYELGHVCREDVSGAGAEGRVLALWVQVPGHVPLAAYVSDGPAVDDVAGEVPPPGFGRGLQEVVDEVLHIHKDVTVSLEDILSLGTKGGHPAHAHKRLQRQIVVGVDKVLHHDVMKDLTLLLHHLVEDGISAAAQQEERDHTHVRECALVTPRLSDGLAGVKFLVCGADEDDEEGRLRLALLGLVDDVAKVVRVERARADVAKGDVLGHLGCPAHGDGQLAHVGGGGAGHTQVPQSTGPANHCQQVQARDLRRHRWSLGWCYQRQQRRNC